MDGGRATGPLLIMISTEELEFYDRNHPYAAIDEEMRRKDDQLRLVFNRRWKFWQVVRRISTVPATWTDVINSVWSGFETVPRDPGMWLLHAMFDHGIQIKTKEDAIEFRQRKNKIRNEKIRQEKIQKRRTVYEIAKEAYPSMEREVVTVDGLKR